MRKMAAIVLFATAAALALTHPAEARKRHHRVTATAEIATPAVDNNGRYLPSTTQPVGYRSAGRIGNCPRSLGCGCNLANYFHIAGRKWRELWVARNWAHEGSPASRGCVGCVAVLSRGRGGHVGVVRAYDANGNPVIYSYANGRLGWTTATYSARRVLAYRRL